jgi:hypothetical protein
MLTPVQVVAFMVVVRRAFSEAPVPVLRSTNLRMATTIRLVAKVMAPFIKYWSFIYA